jgi:hypothetical protein
MDMKGFTALIMVSIVAVSIIVLPALAYAPSVGVKEGDWIEYDISVCGVGTPPPTHDVRWMRLEILSIQGSAFSANITSMYANGTVGSAVWKFNFTEGNVGGWIIIPSNLSPGDTFYDSSIHNKKPVNVTIQSQAQKEVLGTTRIITYGNDSFRHKEWDKATGVFVGSSEVYRNVTNKDGWYIEDLTVTVQAIATNMWSSQIQGLNQTLFYLIVALSILVAVLASSTLLLFVRGKKLKGITLHRSSQGKIAIITIFTVVLAEVASITFFPFYSIGLSIAEINLIMQTMWTALIILSMWFRIKGNYFVHQLTMLIVVCAWIVGFSSVLLMDPFSGGSSETFAGTPLRLVMNGLHAIFSIPALVFSAWLVALWRPQSTTFAVKSRKIALLTIAFWIPSYVVGVLDFMVLHTTIFG